jgi:predicted transposase YbfD/YdcC
MHSTVAPLSRRHTDRIACDGKTSRRSHDRAHDRSPLHLVSAWASGQRLVLGQQACAAKSNEITAIPLLLDRLAIRGALVTIDAIGCQTKIARKILDREADYLLAVKQNWPNLHAEIERAFDDPATTGSLRHQTIDGDHGRIEVRRHAVSHDVAFLQTDRRFPGEPRFPGLNDGELFAARFTEWVASLCTRDAGPGKVRRKSAGWDTDYLEAVIRRTA